METAPIDLSEYTDAGERFADSRVSGKNSENLCRALQPRQRHKPNPTIPPLININEEGSGAPVCVWSSVTSSRAQSANWS